MRYPGAVRDPDTGAWISDAEVAEIAYTAFASTTDAVTARLIVRRVKDARYPDALFPVWRYHPFFTDTDRTRRRGRHHPPPPRDHRNRVRRPHRRTPGPHALRTLRRQLAPGCCARRSPTTCCAPPESLAGRQPRRRARRHPAPQDRQHPRPPGPPPTPTHPAPTQPLALGRQHGLRCGATLFGYTPPRNPPDLTNPPTRPDQEPTGKAGQTSGPATPTIANHHANKIKTIKSLHHPLHRSGGPGESHPRAPTDPGVTVSRHRALVLLVTRRTRPRESISSARTCGGTVRRSPANTRWLFSRPAVVCISCGSSAPGRR